MWSVIEKYSALPFSYDADCCQFVAECIEATTGKNVLDGYSYSGEEGAMALIKKHGSLAATVTAILGHGPYDGAKDGDVTVYDLNTGEQIAGIIYKGRSVVRAKNGLTDWPVDGAKFVWAV